MKMTANRPIERLKGGHEGPGRPGGPLVGVEGGLCRLNCEDWEDTEPFEGIQWEGRLDILLR